MDSINDFLTVESLATFGGTTLAAIVVSNTYRAIFKKNPKIVALIVSIGTCVFFAYDASAEAIGYFIALVNGCLVFCSAFGLNNQVIDTSENTNAVRGMDKGTERFFGKW